MQLATPIDKRPVSTGAFLALLHNVPTPVRLWVTGLAAVTGGVAGAILASGFTLGNSWVVLALAVVAAVAERGRVRLTANTEQSISLVPTLFAAVLFGPLAAMVVGGASMAGDLRRPYMRWLVYTLIRATTGAAAGSLAWFARDLLAHQYGSLALATVLAAGLAEALDVLFVGATAKVRGNDARAVVRTLAPMVSIAVPLYAPVVGLLVLAYEDLSPWTLPLFFVPALAAQRLFGLYQDQRRLAEDLVVVNERLERASISFATALVATLDARDRYTAGHSAAVAIYARDISARLGLSEQDQQLAHVCGLVHDIGKIGLPPGLLEKPGALTLEERRQMQEHSAIGERILSKVEDYMDIAKIVRHHHERIDGMGYPDGLVGDEIPLISRIIGVADAYNAMTSDRPYRDAMPTRVARMRLAQSVESQFDTTVVAAFEAILATASEIYRMGRGVGFTLEEQDEYSAPPIVARVA